MSPGRLGWSAVVASLAWSAVAAQQPVKNPHGKLQEECAVCHSAEAWVPARVGPQFDHAKKGFALVGAHAQTACRSCHASLEFHGVASSCTTCHQDIHRGELGTDCSRCHTPRNFLDRSLMISVHRTTRFPLSGTHLAVDCEACHTPAPEGRLAFVNVSTQCVDCHVSQYQTAKNPDHVAGGFSQSCDECHAATIWTAARFNHDPTGFPLTGMHRTLACAQCHGATGFLLLKTTTCASCHLPNYNAATNPNHTVAAFATTCQDCHNTTAWVPSSWIHTFFRLPHGSGQCVDCHTNQTTFATFVCTICHTQAQTDPRHSAISGYVWNSTNCYGCHHG